MTHPGSNIERSAAEERRSACPGLFRMPKARDGNICRLKLTFGDLTAAQAMLVADAAQRFGSGTIEITNRANLQIRGVRPEMEAPLTAALLDAGLGPLSARGDDVRNVMISPFAGFEPTGHDVRPLASRVLTVLQSDPSYQTLSPKFSILIDGGESVAMVDHPHDLWLSAVDPKDITPCYAFGVAGVPPTRVDAQPALGTVTTNQAFDLITAILDIFSDWRRAHPEASRLRHMISEMGIEYLVEQLELRPGSPLPRKEIGQWRRMYSRPNGHLGPLLDEHGTNCAVGAMPALGCLDPDVLRSLAELADRLGNGKLRMTPWQSVLLPQVSPSDAHAALQALKALKLSSKADEPLATMISCSGMAGCNSALAATRADGLKLASLLRGKPAVPQIHLTGCNKSCASPAAKPVTLVATAPGHYDIFLYATNGPSRFGKLLAAGVTIDEAAELIGKDFGSGGPLHA
ncbi:precorrin-3B synthase [Phyllobacterium endophyticum]|uniref:Precorrin-3B synthase n=1 Tax=Phyllobacterium endophyticum TaxID=1149773 RepID=A0A2P7ALK1_9HYPH|nr:precorrin-3B synthase [Phyllobacterium endophyticum]MBB3236366.1 precorrin-3B synthase [Phyllobacterium endophyticum]PSH55098.1 precorrin-3B synthase [Phyllobacterium endophyticum]TYR39901.1 precorrin-3B synthase [Phyllobacterium endophyticum]